MTQNEMLKTEEIKHPESGRSMVEMLGTLAIMGVLSIGGIAGYRYAVTKYKSNETMDELNRRAMMYGLQMENGNLLSGTILRNGEFGDKTSLGYGVEGFVSGDPTYFEIALSNVPRGVCRDLVKNYTSPVLIDVNGTEYETPSDEWEACGSEALTPEMLFVYSKDLNDMANTPNREVVSNDPFDTPCDTGFYHDPNTGECVEDTICTNANQFFADGLCVPCPTEENPTPIRYWSILTCEKCENSVISGYYCGSYCLYCPSPRVPCGRTCCPQGKVCHDADWYGGYGCVIPDCQTDNDCRENSKPLCNVLTGQCFDGCRTNADCGKNEFCFFEETYITGCNYPQKGHCESLSYSSDATVKGYIYSSAKMDWWSAGNFCKALGLNMVGKVGNLYEISYWTGVSVSECDAFSWSNFGAGFRFYTSFKHEQLFPMHAVCEDDLGIFEQETETTTIDEETTTIDEEITTIGG